MKIPTCSILFIFALESFLSESVWEKGSTSLMSTTGQNFVRELEDLMECSNIEYV